MKISKAVEILELNLRQTGKAMPSDCRDAVKLANEALKRVKYVRDTCHPSLYILLPGEDAD